MRQRFLDASRRVFGKKFVRQSTKPTGSPGSNGSAAPRAVGARVLCIASGKGGTGKSVVATNLAVERSRQGENVLLVDFDAGLANDHLLLGIAPKYELAHVLDGTVDAYGALTDGPSGLKVLSGGVGRLTLANPTRRELDRVFRALRPLEDDFDLVIVDHGAGLGYSTVAHLAAASTLLLVAGHEVTALSDAYAVYKKAHLVNPAVRVGLVINRSPDERLADDSWKRFSAASERFLGHAPEFVGWVPADVAVTKSVHQREPVVLAYPESPSAQSIRSVARWGPIDHARSPVAFYDAARQALR